jgi:hypothetical protein
LNGFIFDALAISLERLFSVIPAKAGIQFFQVVVKTMDPGFRRGDDFLRTHYLYNALISLCA